MSPVGAGDASSCPFILIIENNGYAYSTPTERQSPLSSGYYNNPDTSRWERPHLFEVVTLNGGQRALVMKHVQQCGDCETFWNELQAAQQLVLQLPRERVGEHFREQLWERIRAGEGTPEAVFHEPVPFTVKIRYAMTGAAAAAVVLLGVLALRSDATPQKADLVADSATPNGLRPRVHDGPSDVFLRPRPQPAAGVDGAPDARRGRARSGPPARAALRHNLNR